jgi:hypothetical protein
LVLFQALQMENDRKRAPRAKRESILRRFLQRTPKPSLPLTGDSQHAVAATPVSPSAVFQFRRGDAGVAATKDSRRTREREMVLSIR